MLTALPISLSCLLNNLTKWKKKKTDMKCILQKRDKMFFERRTACSYNPLYGNSLTQFVQDTAPLR